jgi:hypothetical protein
MYIKVKDYVDEYMKYHDYPSGFLRALRIGKYLVIPLVIVMLLGSSLSNASSSSPSSPQLVSELAVVKGILAQVGPALSAVLFIIAGIFYALGQMLPPDKKASFHTTAVNIVIGAIVVGALSAASGTLAIASTHLLGNFTAINGTV